jgi:glutamate 5-kinase
VSAAKAARGASGPGSPRHKRVVVKVGTSTITDSRGHIDEAALVRIVGQMAGLAREGHEMVLVTSGAIAAGLEPLGLEARPTRIAELQATASVGQGLLMHRYTELFAKDGIVTGQVLLTQGDITHRAQFLHAQAALKALLALGAVPVVNENDTTAVEEIRYGDNDLLAALVAMLVKADLLVLLTDIEGLCAVDPRTHAQAKLIERVERITPEIERMAGGAGTHHGSGGMVTKLAAAQIATSSGIPMVIACGGRDGVLTDAAGGRAVGTYFAPSPKALSARKLWIAFARQVRGSVVVDDGARDAICSRGTSLLPAGVVKVKGRFSVGDAVDIVDGAGELVARGLTNFSAHELDQVKGLRSAEVARRLPEHEYDEVVHRDCLVVFEQDETGAVDG